MVVLVFKVFKLLGGSKFTEENHFEAVKRISFVGDYIWTIHKSFPMADAF